MILLESVSHQIITVAKSYLGTPFDFERFNCVHFVRSVYEAAGIELPILNRNGFPPKDFHLSREEFDLMPVGHSVFLRRKESTLCRVWTHVAIITSTDELIHCSRNCGNGVMLTEKEKLLEVYALAAISPAI